MEILLSHDFIVDYLMHNETVDIEAIYRLLLLLLTIVIIFYLPDENILEKIKPRICLIFRGKDYIVGSV